jgi:hypothetical protein
MEKLVLQPGIVTINVGDALEPEWALDPRVAACWDGLREVFENLCVT